VGFGQDLCLAQPDTLVAAVQHRRSHFRDSNPWAQELEANWQEILAELGTVLKRRDLIPNFQDISPEQRAITTDDKWNRLTSTRSCTCCQGTLGARWCVRL
jgi:hypothetical protein